MAGGVGFRTPTTNTAAAATSLALAVPTGTQPGELMYAYFATDSSHGVSGGMSGWSVVDSQLWGGTGTFFGLVFSKVASASEPASYTATNGGASNWLGIMVTLTGVDIGKGTNGQDGFITAGAGVGGIFGGSPVRIDRASMTTAQDGDATFNFVGSQKASTQATYTPPTGYADIQTLVGSTMSIEISAGVKLQAGATGVETTFFSTAVVSAAATGLTVFARHIPVGGRSSLAHIVRASEPPPPYIRPRYARVTDSTPANIFPAPTLTGTTHLGTVALRVDSTTSPTGVVGTLQLGTPQVFSMLNVIGFGQVGTVTIASDMIFSPPRSLLQLRPLQSIVGNVGFSIGAGPAATGLQATGQLGTVVYQSSVGVTSLAASSALGAFTTNVSVSLSPTGQQALAYLGSPIYQSAYPVTGQIATGQLGAATVKNNNLFSELGVVGGGSVGTVGFATSGSSSPNTVAATGVVGVCTFRYDNAFAVTGVTAAGSIGGPSGFGSIAGVQGVGQVGTALAQTSLNASTSGVQSAGAVGSVTLQFDNRATVTGVAATGFVGLVTFVTFLQNTSPSLYTRTTLETLWSTD